MKTREEIRDRLTDLILSKQKLKQFIDSEHKATKDVRIKNALDVVESIYDEKIETLSWVLDYEKGK